MVDCRRFALGRTSALLVVLSLDVSAVAAQEAQDARTTPAQPTLPAQSSAEAASPLQARSLPTADDSPQQPIAPPPPRSDMPMPVGLTGQVNDWLQIRAEFRGRFEGVSGAAFVPDSSDGYWLDRFRFGATIAPANNLRFVIQAHDARAFEKTAGGKAVPYRDTLDLRKAYGEVGGTRNSVRVGRQELAFGEQRLVGHLGWTNTSRSFDGARATFTRTKFKVDLLAASVVTIDPEEFDESGQGNALYGIYGSTTALIHQAVVEPYMFWRQSRGLTVERGGTGDLRQATVGVRTVGQLPSDFDYGAEMALQAGSVSSDDVQAWAGHWVVGKTLGGARSKPRFFGEFNHASGDSDPRDGSRGTFDQLYPTGHDKYGLADQVGWRNIEHLRGGIELKPHRQWQLTGSYHTWWLASARDALYNAGGSAVARSADGSAGRRVGQEVDAQAVYTYSSQLQIAGGYAYLIPGEFLKATTPGHAYRWAYLMVTYVFVGDRPPTGGGGQLR